MTLYNFFPLPNKKENVLSMFVKSSWQLPRLSNISECYTFSTLNAQAENLPSDTNTQHGLSRRNNSVTILQMEHLFSAPFSPHVVQNSASMKPTCPVMAWVSTDNAVGSLPWGKNSVKILFVFFVYYYYFTAPIMITIYCSVASKHNMHHFKLSLHRGRERIFFKSQAVYFICIYPTSFHLLLFQLYERSIWLNITYWGRKTVN